MGTAGTCVVLFEMCLKHVAVVSVPPRLKVFFGHAEDMLEDEKDIETGLLLLGSVGHPT